MTPGDACRFYGDAVVKKGIMMNLFRPVIAGDAVFSVSCFTRNLGPTVITPIRSVAAFAMLKR
jgi:hypothetical protein